MSRLCLDVFLVVWWCPGCVLVVSRFCLGGMVCLGCVLVSWWYLGGVLDALGGVSVVPPLCLGCVLSPGGISVVVSLYFLGGFLLGLGGVLGCVLVVSRLCLGGVSVVSW